MTEREPLAAEFSVVDDSTPRDMVATLVVTPDLTTQIARDRGAHTIALAYQFATESAEDFRDMVPFAKADLDAVQKRLKSVKEQREEFVAPAKQMIENADRMFFKPAKEALEAAEKHLKGVLAGWTEYETKRVEDARRKQEEEERRIRQEAEQQAAAERARKAQEAEEERRKAEAAERERQEKEAEAARLREAGDAQAAARAGQQAAAAAAEAARRDEIARAKLEEGEAKANEITLNAMAATHAPAVTASIPKGFGMRDNWIAETCADEASAIRAIAAALPSRPDLIAYLRLDLSAASKTAKAQKEHMNIPGLKAVNKAVPTNRKDK